MSAIDYLISVLLFLIVPLADAVVISIRQNQPEVTRTNVNKSTVTDIALASSPNEDIALASSQPTATADPNSSAQHGLPPAALAGVVLAGVALVALSGAIMWLVQRRERKTGVPSPLSRASMAARRASVRVKQRASHVKIESKEYLGSGLSDVHEGA